MVQWLWFVKLHVNNAQDLQYCNIFFVFLRFLFMDDFKMEVFCQMYQAYTGENAMHLHKDEFQYSGTIVIWTTGTGWFTVRNVTIHFTIVGQKIKMWRWFCCFSTQHIEQKECPPFWYLKLLPTGFYHPPIVFSQQNWSIFSELKPRFKHKSAEYNLQNNLFSKKLFWGAN